MTVKKVVAKKPVKTTRTVYIGIDVSKDSVDDYEVSDSLKYFGNYQSIYSIEVPIPSLSKAKVIKLKAV